MSVLFELQQQNKPKLHGEVRLITLDLLIILLVS